jgi:protein-S-isoprenylcysteine O-methyltransferase Ste14
LRYFIKIIQGRASVPDEREKTALLAWIVKLFFAPLMIIWLTDHIFNLTNHLYGFWVSLSVWGQSFISLFNNHIFFSAFSLILFLDVFFFTMAYLIETPYLKNTIKSVEPTILWWFVALICYPPFNSSVNSMVGWHSTDFPQFENPLFQIFFWCAILGIMGIYSWASVSLGWKASNLTNRGIVTHGPYKHIRHPAYLCKNTAWWIGAFPFLWSMLANNNLTGFLIGLLSLSTWSFVYYLRAMTEEAHLSLDRDYQEYKEKVKYRFIPKIF